MLYSPWWNFSSFEAFASAKRLTLPAFTKLGRVFSGAKPQILIILLLLISGALSRKSAIGKMWRRNEGKWVNGKIYKSNVNVFHSVCLVNNSILATLCRALNDSFDLDIDISFYITLFFFLSFIDGEYRMRHKVINISIKLMTKYLINNKSDQGIWTTVICYDL